MFTVAVDIGGTFTDVVVIAEDTGATHTAKVLTTPDDLIRGVLGGLQQASAEMGLPLGRLLGEAGRFVHATTQSSNAAITYTGAKTAVLTTRGFADTLTIMRASGRVAGLSVAERHHYRDTRKPRLLADERDIFEVTERVDHLGEVVTELDEAGVRAIATSLRGRGYRSVAVAFLFSYKNPRHEVRVRELLAAEYPELYISLSSEIAPVMGEFERSATALFNAYVGPVMEGYLRRLDQALKGAGLGRGPLIVQSNGGVASLAQTVPILTIESGPAAGVVGAAHLAQSMGLANVISTDVGGTTFKVALIENGQWTYAQETILNQYQLRLPMIDIASIGAGGGSIAWVDGSRLKVGPRSAQAVPGPACYGLGGTEPTVTDADVLLGYISPESFLSGRMKLRVDLAEEAIRRHVAGPMFGGDVLAAAAGIRDIIDNQMADLIRRHTLERGHDPRDFVMMAYGGAGPAHVASYGPEVGITRMIVPFRATVHSAYGAAITDLRYVVQTSQPTVLPCDPRGLEALYAGMEEQGRHLLSQADVPAATWRLMRWVEARYRRQVHLVRVPVAPHLDAHTLAQAARDFEAMYEKLYGAGSAFREAGIECVNFGVDVVGSVKKPPLERAGRGGSALPHTHRPTWCPRRKQMVETAVYDGPSLPAGARIAGPAVIEHPGTTIVIFQEQGAQLDDQGNTQIHVGAA